MPEIEFGLYHYKLIYTAISIIESSGNINNAIPLVFDTIFKNIKPDVGIYFNIENKKIKPLISQGIEIDKIKDFEWEKDGIISTTIELSIPIKSDSIITETILKGKPLIFSGLKYKFDSMISIPVKYNKEIYGIILFLNKARKVNLSEYETLKIIANQIAYHLEINNLRETSEKKCKYLTAILDNMSSAIIIYFDDNIKFINRKAKEIVESDFLIEQKINETIKNAYIKKTNLVRQEIEINSKVIGYSATISKIDSSDILIFVFQDITKFKVKNQI